MYVSSATRHRGRRRLLAVLVVVCAVVLALVVAAGALALSQRGSLPADTFVGGVAVGGLTHADARVLIERAADGQVREPVALEIENAASGATSTVTVTGALLGARPLVDQALEAADEGGLPTRLVRRIGFGERRVVPLAFAFDERRLTKLDRELEDSVEREPRDAELRITPRGATVLPSVEGAALDLAALARALRTLPERVTVPVAVVAPEVTTAAAETVDALLAEPKAVVAGARRVMLPRSFVRRSLVVEPRKGSLAVSLDPDRLVTRLRQGFATRLRKPRDASFRVTGNRVVVVASAPGRDVDAAAVAASLVRRPRITVHAARFSPLRPELTTAEAKALGIRVKVSEFTTYYPCCAPRVTNIQRAAQILDGTVVAPGGQFSLNDELGQRTPERGFVMAPQILAGRLTDAVGGGVSQVATTLFNAAFFAGLRLDAHQAHQFYISRYPMGREATVSWGGPELIFTNDWKAGLLVKVSAWSTGITVRFYSSKLGRRVETVTEDPYGYVQPRVRIVKNPSLKPGERRVVQEAGPAGFTVEYTRKVYRGDELIKDERYRTRYDAENSFVEIGPKKPKPKPKPEVPATDEGGAPAAPDRPG